jgi:hypothetical protein
MRYSFGFVADLHLDNYTYEAGELVCGVSRRAREALACLEKAGGMCEHLFILGDVLHVPLVPIQLITALMETLSKMLANGLRSVRILLGNHESDAAEPRNHALGPLAFVPGVYVYDAPKSVEIEGIKILMCPWYTDLMKIKTKSPHDIALAHHGIWGDWMEPFMKDKGWDWKKLKAWMDREGVSFVLAGDWHSPAQFAHGAITQCGTLIPHSWSDYGFNRGKIYLLNARDGELAEKLEVKEIPGPRFLSVSDNDTAVKLAKQMMADGHIPYIAIPVEKGEKRKPLPELPGAYFKYDPISSAAQAAVSVAEMSQKIQQSSNIVELVEAYLKSRFPKRWDKMLEQITSYIGAAS